MSDQKYPFVSVVVVTFNRGSLTKPCLESLGKQTYPHNRYEVIVVDDGSTDDTVEIAKKEGVRVIEHGKNRGIPSARNTGLAAAKGEITAYIDDDAVADSHWLEYLVEPFADPHITATGGQTFAYKTEYIAERYLSAAGYGNPAPLAFGKSKNLFWRFWVYLKTMFSYGISTKPIEVQAVYTLNSAYRTSALNNIHGFDESLLTDEDTDLSIRLRKIGAHIIFIPNAIIHHRHREHILQLIRQTYRRGEHTFYFYEKDKKVLPIFPLPILYFMLIVLFIFLKPVFGLWFIIIGPFILYAWWPIRAIRKNKFEYLLYGYIQLTLELVAILGLVQGKLRRIKTKVG